MANTKFVSKEKFLFKSFLCQLFRAVKRLAAQPVCECCMLFHYGFALLLVNQDLPEIVDIAANAV